MDAPDAAAIAFFDAVLSSTLAQVGRRSEAGDAASDAVGTDQQTSSDAGGDAGAAPASAAEPISGSVVAEPSSSDGLPSESPSRFEATQANEGAAANSAGAPPPPAGPPPDTASASPHDMPSSSQTGPLPHAVRFGETPIVIHILMEGAHGAFMHGLRPVKKAATASAIASLAKPALSSLAETDRTCSICLEEYSAEQGRGEMPLEMPCHHHFGENCLKEWLKNSASCPLCREAIESKDVPQPFPGMPPPPAEAAAETPGQTGPAAAAANPAAPSGPGLFAGDAAHRSRHIEARIFPLPHHIFYQRERMAESGADEGQQGTGNAPTPGAPPTVVPLDPARGPPSPTDSGSSIRQQIVNTFIRLVFVQSAVANGREEPSSAGSADAASTNETMARRLGNVQDVILARAAMGQRPANPEAGEPEDTLDSVSMRPGEAEWASRIIHTLFEQPDDRGTVPSSHEQSELEVSMCTPHEARVLRRLLLDRGQQRARQMGISPTVADLISRTDRPESPSSNRTGSPSSSSFEGRLPLHGDDSSLESATTFWRMVDGAFRRGTGSLTRHVVNAYRRRRSGSGHMPSPDGSQDNDRMIAERVVDAFLERQASERGRRADQGAGGAVQSSHVDSMQSNRHHPYSRAPGRRPAD